MLNQIVIAGRLTEDPVIVENEEGRKITTITVAVPRYYKNEDGVYDTDFIRCMLWNGIAESTCEYCHKGDVVGVKGRLQTETIENEDGTKNYITNVIAEKLTFLSSSRKDNE